MENKKEDQEVKDPKEAEKHQEKQILWLFIVIAVIFLSFLVPYLYVSHLKKFEYKGIDWKIEDYKNIRVYHGRVHSIALPIMFNLYLRNDPRKNNVSINGSLDKFRYYGAVSFDNASEVCGGELNRAMFDFGSFLWSGLGMKNVTTGVSDKAFAKEMGKKYITCENTKGATVILIKKGDKPQIIHRSKDCYVIELSSCEDIRPIEKFMVEVFYLLRR